MATTITFLGHSGIWIERNGVSLVIDPFLTGNPTATHKPTDLRVQHIALTHGHSDHFGDTLAIAKANRATVYAAWEIAEYLGEQGVKDAQPGNHGGKIRTDFGYIAFTPAIHSSSYNGRYMGEPAGVVVNVHGLTLYHCGDTALFSDMRLIGEIYKPDIACIPIGDRFTMGPELATRAAEMIHPRFAIPVHYNTFPLIAVEVATFRPQDVEVRAMKPGETWKYD